MTLSAKNRQNTLFRHPHKFLGKFCVSLGPSACADCQKSVFCLFFADVPFSAFCHILSIYAYSCGTWKSWRRIRGYAA